MMKGERKDEELAQSNATLLLPNVSKCIFDLLRENRKQLGMSLISWKIKC